MEDEKELWLSLVKNDYGVAKHLFDTYYPKPLEIICFHCQQSSEKAVKALIVAKGAPGGLPQKHDISFLLNQIKNYYNIDDKYYDYADVLTPYGVAVRYPNELGLTELHAVKALDMSREILEWVKVEIGSAI